MPNTAHRRHRERLFSRVHAQPRRPELARLVMIVGISMILSVMFVGLTTDHVAIFSVLR